MRIEFYGKKSQEERDAAFWEFVYEITDAAFRYLEWVLVIGTLKFIHLLTDTDLPSVIANLTTVIMFFHFQALFFQRVQIRFWPEPVSMKGWALDRLFWMIIGGAIVLLAIALCDQLSVAAAAAMMG